MHPWLPSDLILLDERSPLPRHRPFTAQQASGWGVHRSLLRVLVDRGLVRRVVRGVYAAAQMPDTVERRADALSLVVPTGATVTDRTAAWLHGVDILPRTAREVMPPVSVFLPPGRRTRLEGAASGERMLTDADVMVVHGIRVTTPLRTAADLGRLLWRFDALAALDQFLRTGVDRDELIAATRRFIGFRGVVQLRYLTPLADPRAESVAESALRLHWYDAGLPKPEVQLWVPNDRGVEVYRLDLALPDVMYAAEYDGVDHHTSEEDVENDTSRRAWLSGRGWVTDVFTKVDVYGFKADPVPILQAGLVTARRNLSSGPSYPTL